MAEQLLSTSASDAQQQPLCATSPLVSKAVQEIITMFKSWNDTSLQRSHYLSQTEISTLHIHFQAAGLGKYYKKAEMQPGKLFGGTEEKIIHYHRS